MGSGFSLEDGVSSVREARRWGVHTRSATVLVVAEHAGLCALSGIV